MAVPNEQLNEYFAANPDVANAYQLNPMGMTPEQFATAHYQNYGINEQRRAPTFGTGALTQAAQPQTALVAQEPAATTAGALGQAATAVAPSPALDLAQVANTPGVGAAGIGVATPTAFDVKDEVSEAFKSIYGRDPTANEMRALRDTYGMSLESGELQKIVLGNRDYVTGYHQNPYQPAIQSVVPQYQVFTNEFGEDVNRIVGFKDAATGQDVDSSLVKYDNNEEFTGYYIPLTPLDYSGGVLGNLTNQILASSDPSLWRGEGYGSAQKSAADMATLLASIGITDIKQFGKIDVPDDVAVTPVYEQKLVNDPEFGEYMGQVIVGYKDANGKAVDPSLVKASVGEDGGFAYSAPVGTKQVFGNVTTGEVLDPRYAKAQGNIFSGTFAGEGSTGYGVQFRADGSPVFYTQYMGSSNDLAQLLEDPLLGSIIQAAASYFGGPIGNAALNLLAGRDVEDVAKAALTSYVAGQVGNFVSGAESVVDTLGQTGANIAGRVAGSVVTGGGEEGAIQALLSGGMDLAMPEITNLIPGYGDLTSGQREFVKSAIASTLMDGKLSPADLVRAAVSAGKAASKTAGSTTGEIADAGADAFVAAKQTGASDEDAMDVANTVSDVQINPIDPGGPNLSTTTTYDPRVDAVDTNFGDLQSAIEANAMDDAVRADKLNAISQTPKFSDAYAQARTLLGPNQTFEWNGKQYSTATAQERPDLSAPAVQAATDESAAETARLNRLNTALVTGNAPDQSAAETARLANLNAGLKSMDKTSFLGQIYKDLNEQFRLQGEAANEYLRNNPNSPITASVSSAFEAAGELSRNIGGAALAFDNKPLADAIITGGARLQQMGQSIGDGPEDTKNWNDTLALIDKATGTEKLAVLAGRIMDGKSGLARQVGLELRQEIPALFLGGGLLRPTMIASGLIDTADTGGAAVIDAYDDVIKKGGTHQEGLAAGRKAGAAAAATEAAIQLTLGKIADVAAGKLDNVISKGSAKVAGEGVVEGSQEAGASVAVDLALGNAIDVNKALTQGVIGAAVGKGTAASTTPIDAAQTAPTATEVGADTVTAPASTATDLGPIGTTVPGGPVVQSTDLDTIGNVTPSADLVESQAPITVEEAPITVQEAPITVEEAQQSMADLGLNVTDDTAVSLATKIQEATNSGNDVSVNTDANIVTINDATANVQTTVDTKTGITASVDNNTNMTTVVDGNTTTVVDNNANTTSQTVVDGNIQTTVIAEANTNTNTQTVVDTKTDTTTSTTVNTNTNTTTQTTINTNTQTTVVTDPTTNTQTTVKIDTKTGEPIDITETPIPDDWKPPVINAPVVPDVPSVPASATPKVTSKSAPPKSSSLRMGDELLMDDAYMPPLGIDIYGDPLGSRVTQGRIDPLARVKEAQAELERDLMMNQLDPRFANIIQQRTDPQQLTNQFDKDIGALEKLLRGEPSAPEAPSAPSAPSAPANEGKYYSYGSEDSIDDILGGKAANYAAGGYVEPLKAAGGSMALPLLVKSGGALDKYSGRENFKEGKHVAGEGDGQSDDIPAWLADGEFVFPADVVSALGNGSTKAGTDKLYEMMHNIRDRARSNGPKDLPPPAFKSPLDYLKSSKRSK